MVTDFGLYVGDTSEFSLSDYIKEWRLTIYETALFREFKSKDGIQRNKVWEQQASEIEAMTIVFFKCMQS
jgi:hypothetical protein